MQARGWTVEENWLCKPNGRMHGNGVSELVMLVQKLEGFSRLAVCVVEMGHPLRGMGIWREKNMLIHECQLDVSVHFWMSGLSLGRQTSRNYCWTKCVPIPSPSQDDGLHAPA